MRKRQKLSHCQINTAELHHHYKTKRQYKEDFFFFKTKLTVENKGSKQDSHCVTCVHMLQFELDQQVISIYRSNNLSCYYNTKLVFSF